MSFISKDNEKFLNTVRYFNAKHPDAVIVFKTGDTKEIVYEAFLRDADFLEKYLGLHRITSLNDVNWVAFPEDYLNTLVKKITRYFKFIIIEEVQDTEGFQLTINFI
jgi:hypothetical protein